MSKYGNMSAAVDLSVATTSTYVARASLEFLKIIGSEPVYPRGCAIPSHVFYLLYTVVVYVGRVVNQGLKRLSLSICAPPTHALPAPRPLPRTPLPASC